MDHSEIVITASKDWNQLSKELNSLENKIHSQKMDKCLPETNFHKKNYTTFGSIN